MGWIVTSVELGADSAAVRAARGPRFAAARSSLGRGSLGFLKAPGLPYALACGAAAGLAFVGADESSPAVWLAVAVVVVVLASEFSAAPSHERDRALRPVRRLLAIAGVGLLGASSFAWLSPAEMRWELAIVCASAAVFVGVIVLAGLTRGPRTVLLVGGRLGVGQLIAQWASSPDIDVLGVCLPECVDESAHEIVNVPVLGSLDDVVDVAVRLGVDQVVVAAGPLLNAYDVRRLSWGLENSSIELSIAAEVNGVVPRRIVPRALGQRVMLSVLPGRRSRPALWAKGAIDRVGAAFLLVALSPVLVFVGWMVRRDSPGPALFKQTRVGFRGEHFELYKFRTMVVDAEAKLAELGPANEGAGPMFKMAADPRTTRIGRLLRSTSFDELPQLFNVVRGEMSLIGPRPGLPVEIMAYDAWIHRRLRAKPGMTGAWQVGGRSNLNWSESVRLDIDYVDNATLRDDLKIAAKTVRVVISREGAV